MQNFNFVAFFNFNNYYDRKFKRKNTYMDYVNTGTGLFRTNSINFDPKDGITTTVIYNTADGEDLNGESWAKSMPNYAIVLNQYQELESRWFVLNAVRIRGGQYEFSLYRDVVADNLYTVLNSPCFIEKALVPASDPAVFNAEDMTFNQIKTHEIPLMDATNTSWLVAYLAKDRTEDIKITASQSDIADLIAADETAWRKEYDGLWYGNMTNASLGVKFYTGAASDNLEKINTLVEIAGSDPQTTASLTAFTKTTSTVAEGLHSNYMADLTSAQFVQQFGNTFQDILLKLPGVLHGQEIQYSYKISALKKLNGSTIYFADTQSLYQIKVTTSSATMRSAFDMYYASGTATKLYENILQPAWSGLLYIKDYDDISRPSETEKWYSYTYDLEAVTVQLIDLQYSGGAEIELTIPSASLSLEDAPYDMICAPYDNILVQTTGSEFYSTTKDTLTIFSQMAKQLAGEAGTVYDIQRLPYCPIPSLWSELNGEPNAQYILYTQTWNDSNQFAPILKAGKEVGCIFFCNKSNFSTSISLSNSEEYGPVKVADTKIEALCNKYRICSPNYNGVFEINAAMNNGLDTFNIYCTYKPYNPYIQVSPHFDRLYGGNFNDSRGLICGGEWGMPMITSAWETYERQNANYQNIFNRQIENMEVQHGVERTRETVNMIAGTVQGAASGLATAALMGTGPIGMGIGAAIGGGASLAGGITDRILNEQLRTEAIDFAHDQFGYQLGNIKALPNSLARTSAFTVNNKIFPFIECYTCTDEEKKALANKIKYNGMTVMRIGKIKDYLNNYWAYEDIVANNYIKGKLIQCVNFYDEPHMAKVLIEEINKGLYFGGDE